jgi:hypothetical protein
MTKQWYYAQDGRRDGPVSSGQIRDLAASGELRPGDLVWTEGMSDWREARTVKGLIPGLPSARSDTMPGASNPPATGTEDGEEIPVGATASALKQPWYCHPAILGVTTVIFFPTTLVLVWWKSTYSTRARWAWTGASLVVLFIGLANSDPKKGREAPAAAEQAAGRPAANPVGKAADPTPPKSLIEVDGFVGVPPGSSELPAEVLTEAYYPFLEGKSILYSQDVVVDPSKILRTVYSIEPSPGGRLRKLVESRIGIMDGKYRKLPEPKAVEPIEHDPPQLYRLKDGYVEIGMPSGREVWWSPELKLGAKPGDTWESDMPLESSKSRLASIFMLADRPCAVVEKRTHTKGVVSDFEQITWYVKGKGEYRSEMKEAEASGQQRLTWRRELIYFPE